MITNSLSVQTRAFVRGAFSAGGGNTGDGTIRRVVTDRDGEAIEVGSPDVVTLECVLDGNTGTNEGQELFRVYGRPFGTDYVDMLASSGYGSGLSEEIEAATVDRGILFNPTFNSFQGTAAVPTAISNWTVSGASATLADNVAVSTTVYRSAAME